MQPQVHFHNLGHQAYEPVWRQQEALLKAAVDLKIARRKAGLEGTDRSADPALDLPENHLFFVEHPHVLTLGKSGHEEHVVASP
ncbi:MAG: lipoyl(octanoyl) transferase, partial [Bacteroidota bacterium]|nr:lipoyl(octanoyl) transferase [Bacteroidota bacterium]